MKNKEEKNPMSITNRIIAGALAFLMIASVVVGVIAYLI